jgi:hypothetical protein
MIAEATAKANRIIMQAEKLAFRAEARAAKARAVVSDICRIIDAADGGAQKKMNKAAAELVVMDRDLFAQVLVVAKRQGLA